MEHMYNILDNHLTVKFVVIYIQVHIPCRHMARDDSIRDNQDIHFWQLLEQLQTGILDNLSEVHILVP